MPIFLYNGQHSQTGKKQKGTVEAESLRDAKIKLKKQNILAIDIKEDDKAKVSSGDASLWQTINRKAPREEDIALATKQFAILTRSGIDISESLKSVSEQVENKELKAVYVRIKELITEGKSLSDAHKEFPKVFTAVYTNMLAAAEKSGTLSLTLKNLSDFAYYSIEIKRKLVGALIQPVIMICVALAVTIVLFVKILPNITKALKSMKGVVLPWYTVMINDFSAWLQNNWLTLIAGMLISIVIFSFWVKKPKGREQFHAITFRSPIFGPIIQRVAVSRFAKTLGTVLASGVRLVEALKLTRNVVGNAVLEKAIDNSINMIQDGSKLAVALERTGVFPPMMIYMMKTGEKTGKMEEMLRNVAEVYDAEVDDKIILMTKSLQPLMTVVLALIVGIVVVSVMGPMFQAMSSMR